MDEDDCDDDDDDAHKDNPALEFKFDPNSEPGTRHPNSEPEFGTHTRTRNRATAIVTRIGNPHAGIGVGPEFETWTRKPESCMRVLESGLSSHGGSAFHSLPAQNARPAPEL